MKTELIVAFVVSGTIGFLILFNVYLYFDHIRDNTINLLVKNWAYTKYFFLTFGWGVLGGHFFLGTKNPNLDFGTWKPVIIIVVLAGVVLAIGLKQKKPFLLKRRYQLLLLILGLLCGHFFWSLNH